MLLQQLKSSPNSQKVVVDVKENMSLPASISMETFESIRTGSEQGDGLGVALLGPVIQLPLQEKEDLLYLLPKE